MIPPRTRPPGHPAWSMFRYLVFWRGEEVRHHRVGHRLDRAIAQRQDERAEVEQVVGRSVRSVAIIGVRIVRIAELIWQRKAKAIALP